jgi:L-rhamnose-H+ transport protein
MKLMRRYQFEHWWFVGMLFALILIPWAVTVICCPHFLTALRAVPLHSYVLANLWAMAWGGANILCGLCYVRIGMGLTTAILSGLGVCLGVVVPLLVKGSGQFQDAPALLSLAGLASLTGALVAVLGIIMAGRAGSGREQLGLSASRSGGFAKFLALAILAGVFSCGCTMSFVYGQGPIMAAFKKQGAGNMTASVAVWAVGLAGGAMVSVGYAAFLMTQKKSWGMLIGSRREFLLAAVIGLNGGAAMILLGQGMLLMGALGASLGSGLQQISWMLGGQAVGYVSGEWRQVSGRPRRLMWISIGLLLMAALIMILGNSLAENSLYK